MDWKIDGMKLRQYRENRNMSLEDLSLATKIGARYLNNVEHGLLQDVSIRKLIPICAALKIRMRNILIPNDNVN